jgi:hypothetical protein
MLMAALLSINGKVPAQTAAESPMAKRLRFSAMLDSIELQKQALKRKGESLDELEKLTAAIRDSITALKKDLESNEPAAENGNAASIAGQGKSVKKIRGPLAAGRTLDWLILIIAGVAALSGVVLVIGLIQTWRHRSSSGRKNADTYTTGAYSRPQPKPEMPRAQDARSDAAPQSAAFNVDSRIEALRKKIRTQNEAESSEEPPARIPPAAPAAKAGDAPADDLKQKIIDGARQGMSVAELVRTYHVSADQVALILRVTGTIPAQGRDRHA